jgi:hypothetical protein
MLNPGRADTDGLGLASNSSVSYINITVPNGEIGTGVNAHSDVAVTACVSQQRVSTNGGVTVTERVEKERLRTDGHIEITSVAY